MSEELKRAIDLLEESIECIAVVMRRHKNESGALDEDGAKLADIMGYLFTEKSDLERYIDERSTRHQGGTR